MKNWLIKFVDGDIIPVDKMLHFTVAYIMAVTIYLLFYSKGEIIAMSISMGISFVLIILKEIFDKHIKKSGWSNWDIIAGILGTILALIELRILL